MLAEHHPVKLQLGTERLIKIVSGSHDFFVLGLPPTEDYET